VPELALLLPAVFASIHVGAGCGVLAELGPGVVRKMLMLFRRAAQLSASN
jgi:hypothetical protein